MSQCAVYNDTRMKNEPKVYVIQNVSQKNILPAREFGEIEVILTEKEENEEATRILTNTLTGIKPEDFILLIGSPIYIGIACHVGLTVLNGKLSVLVWDKKHFKYNSQVISL